MFKKLLIIAVSLLLLGSCTSATKKWKDGEELDIDEPAVGTAAMESSGNGAVLTDDEDDSEDTDGSADETGNNPSGFIYECMENGEFERLQCRSQPPECWCVDTAGKEIYGTIMKGSEKPDCYGGRNLQPCVFQFLKNSIGLLGTYRPRCDINGEFEQIQCHAVECWCVDSNGKEKADTRVSVGSVPNCEDTTLAATTKSTPTTTPSPATWKPDKPTDKQDHHHHHHKPDDKGKKKDNKDKGEGVYVIPTPKDDKNTILQTDKFDKGFQEVEKENNEIGKSENQEGNRAVIGGAVVGLLCAVLLVMFIVYRMKKKDEGSYALEEQKYTNYSYMKAPDKEFYA
ncbi:hypothetical protein KUTeg_000369 [Tegillarca granosa]|uniref:Syndecan n=1 Tax=Tegillarca granosa TaxID=220873 RepID=A0ABQ9G1P7_TEGGR|nr:hypothetical protein KUTeg_000369 [Tegillarca granosa]